jgi:hypothetical protein
LLKATLLMALYTVRSERQFCEQLDYNILFRWFLDTDTVSPSFDATTFGKNRERLLKHDVAAKFFAVVNEGRRLGLMSGEHGPRHAAEPDASTSSTTPNQRRRRQRLRRRTVRLRMSRAQRDAARRDEREPPPFFFASRG